MSENLKHVMGQIFSSLMGKKELERKELLEEIGENEFIDNARRCIESDNVDMFRYCVIDALNAPVDALLDEVNGKNDMLPFVFKHHGMIERHFQNLFSKIEGRACSADKSRTVIRSLARYCRTGEEIKFDYDGKYTFHLPKKIFKTHDEIMELVKALRTLYVMGRADELIVFYKGFYERLEKLNEETEGENKLSKT